MASSRLGVSAIARLNLSPRSLRDLPNARRDLSPLTPNEVSGSNKFELKTPSKHRVLPFNIDTPNRMKIINKGLPSGDLSTIGSGGFGTVYKALYKGNQVAVKIVKRRKFSDASVEAEKCAINLIHKNIVRYFIIEQGIIWSLISMELCDTSLEEKLEKTILNKEERIKTWSAIACALEFCHNSGIIHADVKPKNVLIASDGQPKLGDFGSSILISKRMENSTSLHGTPGYAAPEVIKGCTPSINSDIYSLGVLAWQLLAREAPFVGHHPHTILYLTGKKVRPTDQNLNDEFNGDYKILYQKMWSDDATSRPPLSVIIDKLNNFL